MLNRTDLDTLTAPITHRHRTWPAPLAALEVRNYRLYLSSQVVATTGLWMQRIAQDWLILELTGSVAAVGIAVALQFTPVLLFGLFGGLIADRYPKRRILIITQSVATLMALTLGTLALTGQVRAWHVFAIATMLGFVTVVDNPTRQVFVSELVGRRHIRNAVSLNSSVFQLGALVGPALSGILINAVGQGWSFLINACACSTVVIMLTVIRPTINQLPTIANRAKGQLREGLSYIRRTSEVLWTISLVAVMGVFGLNMPVVLAAFAEHEFGLGVSGYSMFNSFTAIGALTGALISAHRKGTVRLRTLVATVALLGVALMLASTAPTVWMFALVLVGIGLCTLLFLTGANSLVQLTSAPAVRGRVMSVYLMVLLGGQAVGSPVVGSLIDLVGARPTMFGCGAIVATLTVGFGLKMARQSHLTLSVNAHRVTRPLRIVSTRTLRVSGSATAPSS